MQPLMYIGRFAPSPTGPLHLGSLLTALGSYLDAKHHEGVWLIRIEDLDPPREIAGAAARHIDTLRRFGLCSDKPIIKQSDRHALYEAYLQQLEAQSLTYPCACTRKDLRRQQGIHPFAQCPTYTEHKPPQHAPPPRTSIRLKTPAKTITVTDLLQPPFTAALRDISGDFILRRKDQLFAYHLAVTIDDHLQSITHIVRGADLLDTTPQQQFLQTLFQFTQPTYLHLPTVTHQDGSKLSKQTFAKSIEHAPVSPTLLALLTALGQCPPPSLINKAPTAILNWATKHWSRDRIPKQPTLLSNTIEAHILT